MELVKEYAEGVLECEQEVAGQLWHFEFLVG